MKGYRNYRIDLEHVTDGHIEIIESSKRVTVNSAIKEAVRMSKSKKAKDLWNVRNHYGDLPSRVRVWVYSDENLNVDWMAGIHTMEFVDGECTYDTVG